jgi:hypothetical protein
MQSPQQQSGYPMQPPQQPSYPIHSNYSFGGEIPMQQQFSNNSFSQAPHAGHIKKVFLKVNDFLYDIF